MIGMYLRYLTISGSAASSCGRLFSSSFILLFNRSRLFTAQPSKAGVCRLLTICPTLRRQQRRVLADQAGLEPTTFSLTVRRNYQLCYWSINFMVPLEGNAPTSFDYQSSALLLSYKGTGSNGRTRTYDKHRMKVLH